MGKKWTMAQRRKFKLTMARRREEAAIHEKRVRFATSVKRLARPATRKNLSDEQELYAIQRIMIRWRSLSDTGKAYVRAKLGE